MWQVQDTQTNVGWLRWSPQRQLIHDRVQIFKFDYFGFGHISIWKLLTTPLSSCLLGTFSCLLGWQIFHPYKPLHEASLIRGQRGSCIEFIPLTLNALLLRGRSFKLREFLNYGLRNRPENHWRLYPRRVLTKSLVDLLLWQCRLASGWFVLHICFPASSYLLQV